MQINAVRDHHKSVVSKDKKSLPGLTGILDQDVRAELVADDPTLRLMKNAVTSNDYEGFCRIDPYIRTFWDWVAVVDGCVIIDDRIAISQCLQKAVLSRLHRSHPGQEAMIDAAHYVWWPTIHRDIVSTCKNCTQCTKFGKNLKTMSNFNSAKPLPILNNPKLELQLDYAGPLLDDEGKQVYILVAIDRYSKFPSVMLTCSTGAKKIIKFLSGYISTHSTPKSIKTDQYSGFKNELVNDFCKNKEIKHIFCPVGYHRGFG